MKKKESKKKEKPITLKEKINSQIPVEIKKLFGKFYIFSIFYIIFFAGVFPFVFMKHISLVSKILAILFLTVFYIYIIVDVHKKRKTFMSTIYIVLIVAVFLSISFSIVKIFI